MRKKVGADHIGHRDEHLHIGRGTHHYDVPALPVWACLRLEGVCCLLLYPLCGTCFNRHGQRTSSRSPGSSCATTGMNLDYWSFRVYLANGVLRRLSLWQDW